MIVGLSENDLRTLVKNFFRLKFSFGAAIVHGPGEHGADIIAGVGPNDDPIAKEQLFLIQVKRGDVGLSQWRKGLCGQMAELYHRTTTIPGLNDQAPRRLLLIASGDIKPEALDAINEWNAKMPLPVETIDNQHLGKMLHDQGFRARDVRKQLLGRKRQERPQLTQLGVQGTSPNDDKIVSY